MNKEELLSLINEQWETTVNEVVKECEELFNVKNGNLPKNPEWKGWMLGILEGVNRSFGSLFRKVNSEDVVKETSYEKNRTSSSKENR